MSYLIDTTVILELRRNEPGAYQACINANLRDAVLRKMLRISVIVDARFSVIVDGISG